MSSGLADAAMARIHGSRAAQHAIHRVRQGCGQGEALLEALKAVLATNDRERLHGFMRELEKAVERAA